MTKLFSSSEILKWIQFFYKKIVDLSMYNQLLDHPPTENLFQKKELSYKDTIQRKYAMDTIFLR